MGFYVRGGIPLKGNVRCDGAKNAALPIMAGAVLSGETSVIQNVPRLRDIDTMAALLRSIGADVSISGTSVRIDPRGPLMNEAPYELVRQMRASFLIMGPLLVRYGSASVPLPGGCAIGQRPVDLHLKGFQALGADISIEGGFIRATAKNGLKGAEVCLDSPSVGATENIMMAAAGAQGVTVIENAAQEPEIVDLANYLNAMGADVSGAGTSRVRVEGVSRFVGTRYSIIPDRIEAATFLLAGAISRGNVVVENVIPTHIRSVLAKLKEAGAYLLEGSMSVAVLMTERPDPVSIKTLPYPGFPTDVQAPFMALATYGKGASIISETIFDGRFRHAEELSRMGAKIKIEDSSAIISGVPRLSGATLQATDLRAGACLTLAALAAEGRSHILGIEHIERGYSDFAGKLRSLGADISEEGPGRARKAGSR